MKKGQVVIDLTDKVIDFLKVVRWYGAGHKGNTEWFCECTCGITCIKSYSHLSSKTKTKKTCGTCINNVPVIGRIFGTFKIESLAPNKRMNMSSLSFVGRCIECGYKKNISKQTLKSPSRKRNIGCYSCLMLSRRGGGLKIGDTREYLRITGHIGPKGEGDKKQYYWNVECLFDGPRCQKKMIYSTRTFKANTSCGCKHLQELIKVGGIAAKNHPHHKIYTLYKHINDRCHKPNCDAYEAYGGRGIYVSNEWRREKGHRGQEILLHFVEWCLNNGWKEGLQLDRIDNDGPYAPWNCQFIPLIENLFYSSIDNASESTLTTYIQYYHVWSAALCLVENNDLFTAEEFKAMINRWKIRIQRRAEILKIPFQESSLQKFPKQTHF